MTGEWENSATKRVLENLKSLLASTKCGGELKDLLKQLTYALVYDDEFSCRIEREINEQRKYAVPKNRLVCHYSNPQANSGARSSSSVITGGHTAVFSPAVSSIGSVSQPVLRSRRVSRNARSSSTTSMQRAIARPGKVRGPAPSLSARCSTPSTSF